MKIISIPEPSVKAFRGVSRSIRIKDRDPSSPERKDHHEAPGGVVAPRVGDPERDDVETRPLVGMDRVLLVRGSAVTKPPGPCRRAAAGTILEPDLQGCSPDGVVHGEGGDGGLAGLQDGDGPSLGRGLSHDCDRKGDGKGPSSFIDMHGVLPGGGAPVAEVPAPRGWGSGGQIGEMHGERRIARRRRSGETGQEGNLALDGNGISGEHGRDDEEEDEEDACRNRCSAPANSIAGLFRDLLVGWHAGRKFQGGILRLCRFKSFYLDISRIWSEMPSNYSTALKSGSSLLQVQEPGG